MLHRSQHAQCVMTIAFECEHGVDDVLEHTRTSEPAFFGDMTDEDHGQSAFLCRCHKSGCAFAHLGNRTRSRTDVGRVHRLDGVNNQNCRVDFVDRGKNVRHRGFRRQPQVGLQRVQPFGSQPHLLFGFFGRHVEHFGARRCDRRHRLQQQRGLPDARLATDQRDRTRHQPTAQHTIEFTNAGWLRLPFMGVDVGNGYRGISFTEKCRRRGCRNFVEFFDQRVPALAPRASAHPLGRARTAVGTAEHSSELGHDDTLRSERDTHGLETHSAAPEGAAPNNSRVRMAQPVKAGATGSAAGAVVVVVVVVTGG